MSADPLPVGAYVAAALAAVNIPCDSGEDVDRFLNALEARGYAVVPLRVALDAEAVADVALEERRRVEQAFIDGSVEGSPIDRDGNALASETTDASDDDRGHGESDGGRGLATSEVICPRCNSDTCPGRDDVADCTATIVCSEVERPTVTTLDPLTELIAAALRMRPVWESRNRGAIRDHLDDLEYAARALRADAGLDVDRLAKAFDRPRFAADRTLAVQPSRSHRSGLRPGGVQAMSADPLRLTVGRVVDSMREWLMSSDDPSDDAKAIGVWEDRLSAALEPLASETTAAEHDYTNDDGPDPRRAAVDDVLAYRASPPEYPGMVLVPLTAIERLGRVNELGG